MTTLSNIRTKVRRLTALPSPNQLSEDDIDEYINTFYLHDLPNHLKLYNLKRVYTFYTEPNVATYSLNTDPSFSSSATRAYYSVEPPVFIAGYESYFTQDRTEFIRLYPELETETEQAGDGSSGAYSITVSDTPILRNKVTVSATDTGGNRLIAYDDGAGSLTGDIVSGAVDYDTGAITNLVFTGNIDSSEDITVQTVPYVAGRPSVVLFYNNEFTLKQVPDKTYRVDINAYVYPTVLLNGTDSPDADFLWQLLAIGAAKKILEDRGDFEAVQMLAPTYSEQMTLCQRKTLQQNRPKRASTIYTSQVEGIGGYFYDRF